MLNQKAISPPLTGARPQSRDFLGPVLIALGATVVVAGVILPWVTLFNGLTTVSGMGADGFYLLGVVAAFGLLTAFHMQQGRPPAVRRLLAALGLVVVAVAVFDGWRILSFVNSPGALRPLALPQMGPGTFVTGAGGILLVAGALSLPAIQGARLPEGIWPRLLLAGLLGTPAWIHFAIIGEHLGQTLLLGLGTAGFGVVQALLAVLIVARPRREYYAVAMVVDAALIFFYAYNVMIGLPFAKPELFSPGLLLGHGEAVGLRGAVALTMELLGLGLAFWLSGRGQGAAAASAPV